MTVLLLALTTACVALHLLARHYHGVHQHNQREEELFYAGDSDESRYGRNYEWDDANWDADGDFDPLDDQGLEDSTTEQALQSHYDEQFDGIVDMLAAAEDRHLESVQRVSQKK